MIAYNWKAILEGKATQTRRIVKPGDTVWGPKVYVSYDVVKSLSGRVVWQVGKDYAVQPGRGKKAVARIEILSIRREDVRTISDADVKAEGFSCAARFFDVWVGMHDKPLQKEIAHWFISRRAAVPAEDAANIYRIQMQDRPAERYDAWAIEFEVVK